MSDPVDVKTGEILEESTALAKTSEIEKLVKEQDKPLLGIMQQMNSMNWRDLTPPQLAVLIMQKPFACQKTAYSHWESRGRICFLIGKCRMTYGKIFSPIIRN